MGLGKNIDVSVYADPRFDADQMHEIRRGLESGVDVTIYANPELHDKQMEAIRRKLEADKRGKDIDK